MHVRKQDTREWNADTRDVLIPTHALGRAEGTPALPGPCRGHEHTSLTGTRISLAIDFILNAHIGLALSRIHTRWTRGRGGDGEHLLKSYGMVIQMFVQ